MSSKTFKSRLTAGIFKKSLNTNVIIVENNLNYFSCTLMAVDADVCLLSFKIYSVIPRHDVASLKNSFPKLMQWRGVTSQNNTILTHRTENLKKSQNIHLLVYLLCFYFKEKKNHFINTSTKNFILALFILIRYVEFTHQQMHLFYVYGSVYHIIFYE